MIKKKKDNYKVNKTKILNKLKANITKNNSITHNIGVNNLTNQSLSNSINIVNNETLNKHINSVSVNNQTLNNPINNIINLTKQFNNSLFNSTQNLRYLELKNSNSSYLRDFYLACDRKILILVKRNRNKSYDGPLISVIIPFFNKNLELLRTIRSVQLQTLKNIEIIVVDDEAISAKNYYKNIVNSDFRIRLFTQNKNLGVWRKRIDGFLYSRGEYILHINPGDILSDSFVLEDLYNLVHLYNLDTVRLSFSKTNYNSNFKKNIKFNKKIIYPNIYTKIIYGIPEYNVHLFGYRTIWNRLVRSSILRKALDLVDEDILNAHKDIWEDMWWNDLIDRVSFSNLIVNRLGYIFLYDINNAFEPPSIQKKLGEKTIREFILFWLFDLKLLPKKDNKQIIIDNLKKYIKPDNIFDGETVSLENLIHRYEPYEILLASLIEDPFVSAENRIFAYKLYQDIKNK
jgi:glycosyltransferase involved in cell wall biosynthesis